MPAMFDCDEGDVSGVVEEMILYTAGNSSLQLTASLFSALYEEAMLLVMREAEDDGEIVEDDDVSQM